MITTLLATPTQHPQVHQMATTPAQGVAFGIGVGVFALGLAFVLRRFWGAGAVATFLYFGSGVLLAGSTLGAIAGGLTSQVVLIIPQIVNSIANAAGS